MFPKGANGKFTWKTVDKPLVMGTDTKNKFDVSAVMGLGESNLIEVKGYIFQLDGRTIVLGYLSDWGAASESNRTRFREGSAIGDNAAGCNAVVTTLNSITKEFKEKRQYCFFSAFAAPSGKP